MSPAAVAAKDGNIYMHGSSTPSSIYQATSSSSGRRTAQQPQPQQQQQQQQQSDQVPVIPKSQEVKKFIKEPSYSTMLLPQPEPTSFQMPQAGGGELLLRLQQEQQRQQLQQQKQQPVYVNFDFGEVDEASGGNYYPSPPSPVSSSYSELRQATRVPPGYYIQQMQQQKAAASSNTNYESLYEPIQQPQLNRKQLAAMAADTTYSNRSDVYYKNSSNYSDSSDYFGQCSQCSQRQAVTFQHLIIAIKKILYFYIQNSGRRQRVRGDGSALPRSLLHLLHVWLSAAGQGLLRP